MRKLHCRDYTRHVMSLLQKVAPAALPTARAAQVEEDAAQHKEKVEPSPQAAHTSPVKLSDPVLDPKVAAAWGLPLLGFTGPGVDCIDFSPNWHVFLMVCSYRWSSGCTLSQPRSLQSTAHCTAAQLPKALPSATQWLSVELVWCMADSNSPEVKLGSLKPRFCFRLA